MPLDVKIWEVYMVNHHNKRPRTLQCKGQHRLLQAPVPGPHKHPWQENLRKFKHLRGKKSPYWR